MRVFLNRTIPLPELQNVSCNSCGREVIKDTHGYFEDHLSITKAWGYHSPFDGQIHDIDICIDCYESWVSQFEIPPHVEYTYMQVGEEYA